MTEDRTPYQTTAEARTPDTGGAEPSKPPLIAAYRHSADGGTIGEYRAEPVAAPAAVAVGLVDALMETSMRCSPAAAYAYRDAAQIAARHEQTWTAERAAHAREQAVWQGRERALREIVDDRQKQADNEAPCDAYHAGYKFACATVAAQIEQALADAPKPPT